MTSNIGSRQLKEFGQGVGFSTAAKQAREDEHSKGVIEGALKKAFAPEFLNRIDDVIMFNSLGKEDIHKIIDVELSKLYKRIEALGYKITITEEAKDYVTEKGYDANYGARPLKRAIQKYIEDPMAEEIIKSKMAEGDTLEVGFDKEKQELTVNVIKVNEPAPKKPKKAKED
jgi:ATP-dependent Clp protease ATP-binding subunit ClpC